MLNTEVFEESGTIDVVPPPLDVDQPDDGVEERQKFFSLLSLLLHLVHTTQDDLLRPFFAAEIGEELVDDVGLSIFFGAEDLFLRIF